MNNNNKNKNNEEEEKIYVLLKLNKNIAQLLRIFANTYADDVEGGGSTEEKNRIDNFLSEEVTKIIETLASDPSGPAQELFPDSLKQHVKNLLKEADNNNNKKWMEDLK
jgi:hypothetical protein